MTADATKRHGKKSAGDRHAENTLTGADASSPVAITEGLNQLPDGQLVGDDAARKFAMEQTESEKKISYDLRMAESEYLMLRDLKHTLADAGISVKRSQLIRAGIRLLATLPEAKLKALVVQVTGQANDRADAE